MMKKETYKAAAIGDINFLNEAKDNAEAKAKDKDVEAPILDYSDDDLLGLTSHGNNIIHVAAQFRHLDFIKEALACFPASVDDRRKLISGTNSDGDTPLHLAAKHRSPAFAELLISSYGSPGENELENEYPWRVKNKQGNTPLHVALINGGNSVHVGAYLLRVGPEVAAYTNLLNQTPLHLAVTYHSQGTEMSAIQMINSLNSQGAALSVTNSPFVPEEDDEISSLSLVKSLLKENSEACCLCDKDGMTPLLRAAVRSIIPFVDEIINECPESIEICDPKGKNVLHYITFPTSLEAKKFLENPQLPVLLVDKQDHDGNTPMHVAVMNRDFKMVKAMVELNANFAIENKKGVTAQSLFDQFAINEKLDVSAQTQIESKLNKFRDLVEKENEKEVTKDELMSYEFYKKVASDRPEWDTLIENLKEASFENHFLSRLPDGSNIIHLAFQSFQHYMLSEYSDKPFPGEEFIVEALRKYPILFCQTNRLGQTPLHLETTVPKKYVETREGMQMYKKIKEEMMYLKGRGELPLPPWKAKDLQGNTILHTAIKNYNYEFAEYLIELDVNLVGEVNLSKQTPLHLLCQLAEYLIDLDANLAGEVNHSKQTSMLLQCQQQNYGWVKNRMEVAKLLIEKDVSSAVYLRDVEGLTPLLTAAQHYESVLVAIEILKKHPQLIRQTDPQGQTFFHHLHPDITFYYDRIKSRLCEIVPQKEMEILITQKDDQGNTPFDLALQNGDFFKAEGLIRWSGDLRGQRLTDWILQHRGSTNRMIHSSRISTTFQNFLQSRGVVTISKYALGIKAMRDYLNSMGVMASLFATITFTAAFTLPGRYKTDTTTGIPNLGKEAAFQLFMIFDIIGMCSSSMVLLIFIWLMSEDMERDGVNFEFMLVDMAIKSLEISFYATLTAFMTGVYVTAISITPWIAISTCVLCSFLILLMRRPHIKYFSYIFRLLPLLYVLLTRILCYFLIKFYSKGKSCCQPSPQSQATDHNRDQQQGARK